MPPNPCENFFHIEKRKNPGPGNPPISIIRTNGIALYEKVIFSCKINYNL